ncbi:hypothetical protein LCGC14_0174330 [marine sediment metagenome]|uniref:Uncharacterized protein n=1 Tax=marine sediment metagenome TaxID=412755 RepID=A0A0F9UQZ3_9ZZZZ
MNKKIEPEEKPEIQISEVKDTKRNEFLKKNGITKCYCDIYPDHPDVWNYWSNGTKTCVYCGVERNE